MTGFHEPAFYSAKKMFPKSNTSHVNAYQNEDTHNSQMVDFHCK